jgi:hypothetical protein
MNGPPGVGSHRQRVTGRRVGGWCSGEAQQRLLARCGSPEPRARAPVDARRVTVKGEDRSKEKLLHRGHGEHRFDEANESGRA